MRCYGCPTNYLVESILQGSKKQDPAAQTSLQGYAPNQPSAVRETVPPRCYQRAADSVRSAVIPTRGFPGIRNPCQVRQGLSPASKYSDNAHRDLPPATLIHPAHL